MKTVTWRKIGSEKKGHGQLVSPIEKGKKLIIVDEEGDGIITTRIKDTIFDAKRNLCLVYTMNSIYEVCFE